MSTGGGSDVSWPASGGSGWFDRATAAGELEAMERRRLEQDLHDGPQQTLVALLITLESVRHGLSHGRDSAAGLELATRLTRRALTELRALAQGAYSRLLETTGLAAALEALRLGEGPSVHVEAATGPDLDPAVATAAYFVCCEAVANARKHAGATHITVRVRTDGGLLIIEVDDDGVGGARPDGTGLRGIGQRARMLGGTFAVASPPGAGTHVRATIPLPRGA